MCNFDCLKKLACTLSATQRRPGATVILYVLSAAEMIHMSSSLTVGPVELTVLRKVSATKKVQFRMHLQAALSQLQEQESAQQANQVRHPAS